MDAAGLRQFGAGQSEVLENAFKVETVGLVTKAEFLSKRNSIRDRLEEEQKRSRRAVTEAAHQVGLGFRFLGRRPHIQRTLLGQLLASRTFRMLRSFRGCAVTASSPRLMNSTGLSRAPPWASSPATRLEPTLSAGLHHLEPLFGLFRVQPLFRKETLARHGPSRQHEVPSAASGGTAPVCQ